MVVGPLSGGVAIYDDARPYSQGSTHYITAAWGERDIANGVVPIEILIGDGQEFIVVFGGASVDYQNEPLNPGMDYNFFTRYDIRNEQEGGQVKMMQMK